MWARSYSRRFEIVCGYVQTAAVVGLIAEKARALASAEDETVISKKIVPPTGDKRTYMSLATYCWPSNPEDLDHPKDPWVCKDSIPFDGVCASS